MKEVCTQIISIGANLEGRTMFPMRRAIETCNVKLMN